MSDKPNRLKEAIMKTEGEPYWKDLTQKAKQNPFTRRYCEGINATLLEPDSPEAFRYLISVLIYVKIEDRNVGDSNIDGFQN